MNVLRELLLSVLKPFFTGASADTCLAGRGIRNACAAGVVTPRVCTDATLASPSSSALHVRAAVPSADSRVAAFSCKECIDLFVLVTGFVPEKQATSPRGRAA